MQFLANENSSLDLVESLRKEGHDVTWIRTDAPHQEIRAVATTTSAAGFAWLAPPRLDFGSDLFQR
jgi:hypothetical protein